MKCSLRQPAIFMVGVSLPARRICKATVLKMLRLIGAFPVFLPQFGDMLLNCFDGYSVVAFFNVNVGALVESGESFQGVREFFERSRADLPWLEVEVVDDKCFVLSVGLGVHSRDKCVAEEHGQSEVSIFTFRSGYKAFYLIIEVEEIT